MKTINICGYSGHAFVICDAIISVGDQVSHYLDKKEKQNNPYNLIYAGTEEIIQESFKNKFQRYIIGIGDNHNRERVSSIMAKNYGPSETVTHKNSFVSPLATLCDGVFVNAGVVINALAEIKEGSICNSSCLIEHECSIGRYSHIAPGAVLAGGVVVGDYSFIGANSVIKQGIRIGSNVIIGAGAVVVKNIPDNSIIIGNPGRSLHGK